MHVKLYQQDKKDESPSCFFNNLLYPGILGIRDSRRSTRVGFNRSQHEFYYGAIKFSPGDKELKVDLPKRRFRKDICLRSRR